MEKKSYKTYKRKKIYIFLFLILFLIVCRLIFNVMIYIYPFLIGGSVIVYFILYAIYKSSSNKRLKSNTEEIRVKYIDTFYRKHQFDNHDGGQEIKAEVYVVVEDKNGQKYCIDILSCNTTKVITSNSVEILSGSGFVNEKNFVRISEGHEASLWGRYELTGALEIYEENKISFFGKKMLYVEPNSYNGEFDALTNTNKNNNLSLLQNVIFVDGYLEFDNYKNGKLQRKEY